MDGARDCGDSAEVMTMISRIDRTSSIENEPRTLHFNQMEYARKAAMYVMNTCSMEDALRIFTEGLEPPVRRLRISEEEESDESRWDDVFDYNHHMHVRHTSSGFKDIATAPF